MSSSFFWPHQTQSGYVKLSLKTLILILTLLFCFQSYGPFWIYTSIVIVLGAAGNIYRYLALPVKPYFFSIWLNINFVAPIQGILHPQFLFFTSSHWHCRNYHNSLYNVWILNLLKPSIGVWFRLWDAFNNLPPF